MKKISHPAREAAGPKHLTLCKIQYSKLTFEFMFVAWAWQSIAKVQLAALQALGDLGPLASDATSKDVLSVVVGHKDQSAC